MGLFEFDSEEMDGGSVKVYDVESLEDIDGFVGYIETSVDPGQAIIWATLTFVVSCACILLCMLQFVKWYYGDSNQHDNGKKIAGNYQNVLNPEFASSSSNVSIPSSESSAETFPTVITNFAVASALLGSRKRRRRRRNIAKNHVALRDNKFRPMATEAPIEVRHIEIEDGYLSDDQGLRQISAESTAAIASGLTGGFDPKLPEGLWEKISKIFDYDIETKKLTKLMIPFVLQAASTGFLDVIEIGVIGKLIGTNELAAHVVVQFCLETSANFVAGFIESLATLCSQSIGVGNKKLTGQYVQLALIMYTLFWIPFMILWVSCMDKVIILFGFDIETGIPAIGKRYALFVAFDYLLDGFGECVHALLDVIGKEDYSTFIGITEEVTAIVTIFIAASRYDLDLMDIAAIQLVLGIIFLMTNIVYIYIRGWFKKYLHGLIGSFAFRNKTATVLMFKTALSLSLGYLLTMGEWEVLAIFAGFLGPAEVAAWGIIGTVWNALEKITESVGDAAEVRVAFLLGCGQPTRAKLSAYKGMALGSCLGLALTTIVLISGPNLPTWITDDPALQRMVGPSIPLLGFGILSLSTGMLCWPILGAQGRYRLATIVVCFASWFVTLPLAAIFSIALRINVQGQTAAVVAGYTVSGALNMFFVLRSDWMTLSKSVIAANAALEEEDSESDSGCEDVKSIVLDKKDGRVTSTVNSLDSHSSSTTLPPEEIKILNATWPKKCIEERRLMELELPSDTYKDKAQDQKAYGNTVVDEFDSCEVVLHTRMKGQPQSNEE